MTCQVTAVLVVPVTLAVNCCVVPFCVVTLVGVTEIPTTVTVTIAEPDLLLSVWFVAVTVTFAGLGTDAGAVYRPEVDTVPTVELPPATPLTLQLTPAVEFLTVAVNC